MKHKFFKLLALTLALLMLLPAALASCAKKPDEELEITHRAASRQIFVNGALHMARKLYRQDKGRYELQELLFGNRN